MEIDNITTYRYALGRSINSISTIICASDNIDFLLEQFEEFKFTTQQLTTIQHIEYYVYDYDKNCYVEYYDNKSDQS